MILMRPLGLMELSDSPRLLSFWRLVETLLTQEILPTKGKRRRQSCVHGRFCISMTASQSDLFNLQIPIQPPLPFLSVSLRVLFPLSFSRRRRADSPHKLESQRPFQIFGNLAGSAWDDDRSGRYRFGPLQGTILDESQSWQGQIMLSSPISANVGLSVSFPFYGNSIGRFMTATATATATTSTV